MAKNLVIVESPAKAKTINKLLGGEFVVKASMGHVRDLPERSLGVDVENGFAPQYVAIKGRTKILSELQALAAKAEMVYLAPDPDREGEAIAWHLREALKGKSPSLEKFRRVTYNEITAAAIRKPEIGEAARQMEETITGLLCAIFARVTRRSREEASERYQGQCQMLVMLVKAMATRTAQCGPASPALSAQVVAVIDRMLAEISNDIAKG